MKQLASRLVKHAIRRRGWGEASAYLSTQRLEALNTDYLNVGSGALIFVALQSNKFHSNLLRLIIVIAR